MRLLRDCAKITTGIHTHKSPFLSDHKMRPEHLWIIDATTRPPLLEVAVRMCVRQYVKLYAPTLTEQESRPYFASTLNHCRVLVAVGRDASNSTAHVLGTASVRFGNGTSLPLELMELVSPKGGWQEFSEHGFEPSVVAESCRFAYSEACEGNTDEAVTLRIEVFRRLHNASLLVLEQHDCNQLWAVLPLHVAMFIKHYCNVPVKRAATVRLNEDYQKLFDAYPGYWREGQPGLYRTGFPIESISCPTTVESIPFSAVSMPMPNSSGEASDG